MGEMCDLFFKAATQPAICPIQTYKSSLSDVNGVIYLLWPQNISPLAGMDANSVISSMVPFQSTREQPACCNYFFGVGFRA